MLIILLMLRDGPNVRLSLAWQHVIMRLKFGIICGFAFAAFCARHKR